MIHFGPAELGLCLAALLSWMALIAHRSLAIRAGDHSSLARLQATLARHGSLLLLAVCLVLPLTSIFAGPFALFFHLPESVSLPTREVSVRLWYGLTFLLIIPLCVLGFVLSEFFPFGRYLRLEIMAAASLAVLAATLLIA